MVYFNFYLNSQMITTNYPANWLLLNSNDNKRLQVHFYLDLLPISI